MLRNKLNKVSFFLPCRLAPRCCQQLEWFRPLWKLTSELQLHPLELQWLLHDHRHHRGGGHLDDHQCMILLWYGNCVDADIVLMFMWYGNENLNHIELKISSYWPSIPAIAFSSSKPSSFRLLSVSCFLCRGFTVDGDQQHVKYNSWFFIENYLQKAFFGGVYDFKDINKHASKKEKSLQFFCFLAVDKFAEKHGNPSDQSMLA